jgi:hypothetical protein
MNPSPKISTFLFTLEITKSKKMKSLFSTQCVALSLSAGIGLGSVLIGSAPSEAQVTINVTGGTFSGTSAGVPTPVTRDATGTLITPYGVYTGAFMSSSSNWFTHTSTTSVVSFGNNDFQGTGYVNGTATPFTGNLALSFDSAIPLLGSYTTNITSGTITLNTLTTLTGFSFEAPAPPAPPTTSVTPPTTTPTATPTATPTTVQIPELTATTFTTPEPLTEPGGAGQAALRSQGQQPQQFRPNGVHTRIIPIWTPGLYQ